MIHGFLESSQMWDALSLELLGTSFICIDLPGHGASSFNGLINVEKGMEELAYAVVEVLDSLNIHDFNIVGHSLGGYVALEVKRIRRNCKKLVLLNSNYGEDSPAKIVDRKRIASIVKKSKSLFIQKAIPSLFSNPSANKNEISDMIASALKIPSEAIAWTSLVMASRKKWTSLKPSKDFYMIQGTLDHLHGNRGTEFHLLDKNQIFKIDNAGHMSHIENPSELKRILKQILEL
ncbi:alpha/beta hydrolase [Crocinitomicaceae bacterium]|nr:alpha/beta hydrolase [Crocinitomicaceae bacterium]